MGGETTTEGIRYKPSQMKECPLLSLRRPERRSQLRVSGARRLNSMRVNVRKNCLPRHPRVDPSAVDQDQEGYGEDKQHNENEGNQEDEPGQNLQEPGGTYQEDENTQDNQEEDSTDIEIEKDDKYDIKGQFDDEDYEGVVFVQDVLCIVQEKAGIIVNPQ